MPERDPLEMAQKVIELDPEIAALNKDNPPWLVAFVRDTVQPIARALVAYAEAVEAAPHGAVCLCRELRCKDCGKPRRNCLAGGTQNDDEYFPCDCWKSRIGVGRAE